MFKLRLEGLDDVLELFGKISLTRKELVGFKVKEAIVKCLGFISASVMGKNVCDKVLSRLFAVGEVCFFLKIEFSLGVNSRLLMQKKVIFAQGVPLPELQFTVGSSLFDAVMGEHSPSRRNFVTETEEDYLVTFCHLVSHKSSYSNFFAWCILFH